MTGLTALQTSKTTYSERLERSLPRAVSCSPAPPRDRGKVHRHITKTRFGHLVAALPNEVALEVYDALSNPPTAAPYDALKGAILEPTNMLLATAADLTLPALALHVDKIMKVVPPQAYGHKSNALQLFEAQQQRFASSEEITALREVVKNLITLDASSLTSNLAGTIANLVPEQNAARKFLGGRETKPGNN
ncbi:hypothetical protein HPB47_011609 [Ixodes persulcatus]|uniref:Uncharacterized protein n=1 Tax=Ixodes persulcatus TaxID=34615 RepID=A0AC60NVY9_IXOPE|nr:hypothetical protein HPB47_011609 [Ixodes persulcatus]